ncbi:hypothetical protein J4427_03090 [Candidatus Woesearchaeota archaeon]|nr:hypothetical protein [Candidatus Woesearchaeota archaeon]
MNTYEVGKFYERKEILYLKKLKFKDIHWISKKQPTSHFDITAKKDDKLFYIEVRYTKSKKFLITEKKLKELKKLDNVLFLLFSPKNQRLVTLEDIEKDPNISINKGQLSNINIRKRKIRRNIRSLLAKFSNITKVRIIDFLSDNYPLDFSKEEIARNLEVSRQVIFNSWIFLEMYNIIKPRRKFGKTILYALNSESLIVKKILDLEKVLIVKSMENAKDKILIPV